MDKTVARLQELSAKCAEMQQGRYVLTNAELEEIERNLAYLGFLEEEGEIGEYGLDNRYELSID